MGLASASGLLCFLPWQLPLFKAHLSLSLGAISLPISISRMLKPISLPIKLLTIPQSPRAPRHCLPNTPFLRTPHARTALSAPLLPQSACWVDLPYRDLGLRLSQGGCVMGSPASQTGSRGAQVPARKHPSSHQGPSFSAPGSLLAEVGLGGIHRLRSQAPVGCAAMALNLGLLRPWPLAGNGVPAPGAGASAGLLTPGCQAVAFCGLAWGDAKGRQASQSGLSQGPGHQDRERQRPGRVQRSV